MADLWAVRQSSAGLASSQTLIAAGIHGGMSATPLGTPLATHHLRPHWASALRPAQCTIPSFSGRQMIQLSPESSPRLPGTFFTGQSLSSPSWISREVYFSARLSLPDYHGRILPSAAGSAHKGGRRPGFGHGHGLGHPQDNPSHSGRPMHQWHYRRTPSSPDASQPQGVGQEHSQEAIARRSGRRRAEEEGDGEAQVRAEHPACAVVLLGWLGAKQRHLRRYAEWYNSQGMDAITFVIPMMDLLSLNPTEQADVHVDNLVSELERWLQEDEGESTAPNAQGAPRKKFIFHTFSNTGWLAYGSVLKRLQERHGEDVASRMIMGCVVDSAPVLRLDPQVFAAGFAAAILGKRSSSTRTRNVVLAGEAPEGSAPAALPRARMAGAAIAAEVDGTQRMKMGQSSGGEAGQTAQAGPHPSVAEEQEEPTLRAGAGQGVRSERERREEDQRQGAEKHEPAGEGPGASQAWRRRVHLGGLVQELGHAMSEDDVDALLIRVGEKRSGQGGEGGPDGERAAADAEHMGALEWTLRAFLTRFFSVLLERESIRSKFLDITSVLETRQPPCPQLYIYSSADTVIPAADVEDFMRIQRASGLQVASRRFGNSPHVDHFRTFPELYTEELRAFLDRIGLVAAN